MSNGPKPITAAPIEHVIVLMLENRSFDHMLGDLRGKTSELTDLAGIDPAKPRTNRVDDDLEPYVQSAGAARVLIHDPKHEYIDVVGQINLKPDGTCDNSGFVRDYARAYPVTKRGEREEVMKYFADGQLPALHTLAKAFTICDHWFSSLPGPTWPNRFFAHSGTSLGRVTMPDGIFNLHLHWYNQTTIYDRLNEAGKAWKIYHGDVPQSLLLVHQLEPKNLRNYAKLGQFFVDLGAASKDKPFPEFVFIEPDYYTPGATDDHPPHDVLAGDRLIADVYNGVHASSIWHSTLLVVVWDEHGGFYDHVPPPAAVPPDHHQEEYTFDRYGVRVPAILISPFTKPGFVATVFDHTSILSFVIERWQLGPLSSRVAEATSIGDSLDFTQTNRGPTAVFTTAQGPPPPAVHSVTLNANQRSLASYAQYLATITPNLDPVKMNERTAFMMTSARAQSDTACDHTDAFIQQAQGVATNQHPDPSGKEIPQ